MSVFGSAIKESLSTTTLSDATLTNSLKEVTVRRIPVNEGKYLKSYCVKAGTINLYEKPELKLKISI